MENQNNRKFITAFWVVIIVILAIVAWYFIATKQSSNQDTKNQAATTTINTSATTTASGQPGSNNQIIITQPKPQKVSTPAPSLSRPLPDTTKLNASLVLNVEAAWKVSIANLKKDPTLFQDWIDLGFERKSLGDYTGAAEDWEYVSLLYPQNTISFGDLGDLYTNYLKDNAKAEARYQTGIKNAPGHIDYYRNLYNLYISEHKNAEAIAVLESGISKNPNIYDLSILLARYYRDAGNPTSAKIYYDKAIAVAQAQGNVQIADILKDEEGAVK